MPVAATAIGGNQQAGGVGIAGWSHGEPPAADGVDREAGGIVIGADADPAFVIADIVNAVWDGPPQFRIDKVMYVDRFRRTLRTPLPAVVL